MSSEGQTRPPGRVPAVFSVDVDDFPGSEAGVEWLLDLLAREKGPGSFFVTGKFASRQPALVREIKDKGHEVACHGWAHGLDWDEDFGRMSPEEQLRRLRLANGAIQQACGMAPTGFRAPYLSVGGDTLRSLAGTGYRWDSSVGSGRFDFGLGRVNRLGYVFAPRVPYRPDWTRPERRGAADLTEVPCSAAGLPFSLTTGRVFGPRILSFVGRWVFRRFRPVVFLLHPWELVETGKVDHGRRLPGRHLKRRGAEAKVIVEAVLASWRERMELTTFERVVGGHEANRIA